MAKTTTINVSNLSKIWGNNHAVDSISFSTHIGEVVGFVGPNGAGKTTTISMLLGFIKPTYGIAQIKGMNVTPQSAHSTHGNIGYVAGDMELFDNLRGEQYLEFLARQYGKNAKQKELIKRLQPKMGQKLKHLSRGNKQKIALIGALQHQPKILILDEPTSGLDPLMQETFLSIIREELEQGASVLMSSHNLAEVASACDRVMFIKRGKIVTDQPINGLEKASGKIITITTDHRDTEQMAGHLIDGAELIEKTPTKLKIRFDGDMRVFVSWLNDRPILDLEVTDRDLDDIFHDLYKDSDEETK